MAMLAYTYVGYPAWLWLRGRFARDPVAASGGTPSVSIVMVVRNEAAFWKASCAICWRLIIPRTVEIVVVSDGSTDATNDILSGAPQIRAVKVASRSGVARQSCRTERCHRTCARRNHCLYRRAPEDRAGRAADAGGTVCRSRCGLRQRRVDAGRSRLRRSGTRHGLVLAHREDGSRDGIGVRVGSGRNRCHLRGQTAACVVPLPAGTILDDVYIPMHVVRQGFRVIFVPSAHAWDVADQGAEREFSRKVRTLTGNYQLLQLAPWLLSSANPLRFEFVSHKLLRLFAPFALVAALIAALALPQPYLSCCADLAGRLLRVSGLIAMTKLLRGPAGARR